MRIASLGAVSAADALASAAAGQTTAANTVAMTGPQDNGFPGFDAIWAKVFGIAQGILTPAPTVASVEPPQVDPIQQAMPIVAIAGIGLATMLLLGKKKRGRR